MIPIQTRCAAVLLAVSICLCAGCQKHATTESSSPPQSLIAPKPRSTSTVAAFDVCGLIKPAEIQAVVGSPITDSKSSGHSDQGFRLSQCYYSAAESSKSVSLSVTQTDPDAPSGRTMAAFWKETFTADKTAPANEADREKKESLEKEEREKGPPIKKISGVGEDAYWSASRVGGALYVLKKDNLIRISVGGADTEDTKIDKSKKLAQKAADRL